MGLGLMIEKGSVRDSFSATGGHVIQPLMMTD